MAALARFYPRGPVNVAARLKSLPEDGVRSRHAPAGAQFTPPATASAT